MRNRNYILKKVNNSEYGYLSISTNYSRLDEYLTQIEKDLKKKNFEGKIVFDLLSNNGLKDRFYQATFDGEKVILSSITNVSFLETSIKRASSKYYLSHFDLFRTSYHSKYSKFLIKRELEKSL